MEIILNEIKEIKELLFALNIQQKERLTLEEAASYLQLSKSCLYKLTSKKEIPCFKPLGKKIYFNKLELDEWVFAGRVSTIAQVDYSIDSYLSEPLKKKV